MRRYNRFDALQIEDMTDIGLYLLQKINCSIRYPNADCQNCLSASKMQMSGIIGTTVTREEFKNVSIVLFCYLLDLPQFCYYNSIPDVRTCYNILTGQTNSINKTQLDTYITGRLKPIYSPIKSISNYSMGFPSVECIEAKKLLKKYGSDDAITGYEALSNVASDVLSSMFNDAPIGCEVPYQTWFSDQLYLSYVPEGASTMNISGLVRLMYDMDLAIETDFGEKRKKRSIYSLFPQQEQQQQQQQQPFIPSQHFPQQQQLPFLPPQVQIKQQTPLEQQQLPFVPPQVQIKQQTPLEQQQVPQLQEQSTTTEQPLSEASNLPLIQKRDSTLLNYQKCYSPEQLLDIYQISKDSISKFDLERLTTSLVYLSSKKVCNKRLMTSLERKAEITNAEKYGYGTIAVGIVSVMALLGIFLLPCFNRRIYEDILMALTGLAVGTLFCDAVLHILPVVIGIEHEHGGSGGSNDKIVIPNYVFKLCVIIFSLYIFWFLEVVFQKLTGVGHSHGMSSGSGNNGNSNGNRQITPTGSYNSYNTSNGSNSNNIIFPPAPTVFNPELVYQPENKEVENNKIGGLCSFKNVKATGWLLLLGDAIHNIADGLAIGASFAESTKIGVSTTIAIVCHEIPHELGTYAVLVKSGFSHVQALIFNLFSAGACFIGFYIGASAASDPEVSVWIFSVTAGMFFYISLVDLLPELSLTTNWTWKTFIFVNIFMWIGFSIMFLLVVFEDHISI